MERFFFRNSESLFSLDLALKQSCFVCFSAVLTINAPLTEVVDTMQETRAMPGQCFGTVSGASGEVSRPVGACSKSSVKTTKPSDSIPPPTNPEFPWLICECFSILQGPNKARDAESDTDDAVSTLRSEVLLVLIVFVRNYFTLLR